MSAAPERAIRMVQSGYVAKPRAYLATAIRNAKAEQNGKPNAGEQRRIHQILAATRPVALENPRRNTMGILKVTIEVGDSQGRQFEELDVTVDTGSTYTAVPKAMLQRLGIPVERSLPSETADGRIVPVDVGEATIRLEGLQFHTPVIFAEENEPSLLGVVSLEQAALAVAPVAGRLIPTNLLRL